MATLAGNKKKTQLKILLWIKKMEPKWKWAKNAEFLWLQAVLPRFRIVCENEERAKKWEKCAYALKATHDLNQ